MSSPPNMDQSTSRAKHRNRHDRGLNAPESSSVHEHDTASELRSTPDRNYAPTRSATRSSSHQPSEASEMTMLGGFYDGGTFDNASSVTLQDEFPWHEVGANKYTQKIPSTIVPALLQGMDSVSPSRSSLDGEKGGSRVVDEGSSDSGDVPRYSAAQKGKWNARTDGDVMQGSRWVRSPSPQFHFDNIYHPVEDWVMHTKPILQDYADRQMSLPLGRRLEVSIDEPPQFILGAIQLLVNRDSGGCTDRSRQLGPQLIENFVDIERWAKEYFRSRHGTQAVDSDIPALLTIVMNNFYEGQVQLIDRLVEFALENMRFCGRSSLGIEDFAFGFDFKMSQDLPFYVETSSQIREPLPIRAVEVQPTSEPVITNSGRQVKPTERAQAASEQAQANVRVRPNKGRDASQVKDKQAPKGSVQPARQKNNPAQPSAQPTVQQTPVPPQPEPHPATLALPKTTSEHTKHRPVRPSNLGLPPVLPGSSSTTGATPLQLDNSRKSESSASASADSPKVSAPSGGNLTVNPSSCLKIILPPPSLPASTVPAASRSGSVSSDTNSSTSQLNPPANASKTTDSGRGASRPGGARPRGPRNGRGRGRGRERGRTSPTPSAETPEATPDNTKALPKAHPVSAGNADASAAVKPLVAHPTLAYALRSAAGRARPSGANNGIGIRDNGPFTSRITCTSQPLLIPTDPGHPQTKKRKLDDCED